jgi:hypothetical protein
MQDYLKFTTPPGVASPKRLPNLTQQTATATKINSPAPPDIFTCATCPLTRLIEGVSYCRTLSFTAADVTGGHWEAKVSFHEAITERESRRSCYSLLI